MYLLDTSVVIALRDGDEAIETRFADIDGNVSISSITLAELTSGLAVEPIERARREVRLDLLLTGIRVLKFGESEVEAYKNIVLSIGYSRTEFIDRLIASQAITSDRIVVTTNARHFLKIPDLKVADWSN